MHIYSRLIIVVAVIVISLAMLYGQAPASKDAVSESRVYVPRDTEKPKKDNKKAIATVAAGATDTVTIPVSVLSRDGNLIQGLADSDFEVEIDGKPTTVREIKRAKDKLDVVLLLDLSPSAGGSIDTLKKIALQLLAKFRPDDRITLASFDSSFKVIEQSSTDRARLDNAIKKIRWSSGTAIYDGIGEIFDKTFANSEPDAVIVVTDGVDTVSQDYSYESSLISAEKRSSKIFVVYLDTFANRPMSRNSTNTPSIPDLPSIPGATVKVIQLDTWPLPRSRARLGTSEAEYDRGNQYLTDLIRLSGGRPMMANKILTGQGIDLDSIPFELANQYYLVVERPARATPGTRRSLTVRVKLPGLILYTKGSLID